MKKYLVKEIFGPTIQGEGSYTGQACLFLRFSGCNKWSGRPEDKPNSICSFCDTDFVGGERMDSKEIIRRLGEIRGDIEILVLSGGEPALQVDEALCKELSEAGFELHIETNGSRKLGPSLPYLAHITCSPKQKAADTVLEYFHDLKLLFPFVKGINLEDFKSIHERYENVFLQPVWDDNYTQNIFKTVNRIYKEPNLRLSLQTHKITGLE